jgi:hypothetical protein
LRGSKQASKNKKAKPARTSISLPKAAASHAERKQTYSLALIVRVSMGIVCSMGLVV